ncbi:MAG: oxygen-independent coproporphyrinogen III oxidase [Cellvibrio sp.]
MSHLNKQFTPALQWDAQLIRQYDLSGPRYTSYPTAPQFSETFSAEDFNTAVERSNASQRPLSLYFHIPFCDTLCFYCGCNKVVTNNKGRAKPYLDSVVREIAMQAERFDTRRPVKQLHWGGGTPTFINCDEMSLLMNATRQHFNLVDDESGEFSIEIHPGRVTASTMEHLRNLGFNRVSMGVQDFDLRVQKAVNRYNTLEDVTSLMEALRRQSYHSISMDLIYGLPLQTRQSFATTLNRVIDLSPDRLSLFNYAHLPHLFKSQALIKEEELPSAEQKLDILQMSIEMLQNAGYVYIGMDHFAKPEDSLVQAQRAGVLQRNFQGYSTHGDCDLIAMGVSSISSFGGVYVQNAKNVEQYQKLIDKGESASIRGFTLSAEDHLRQFVINQLICQFSLSFNDIQQYFSVDPKIHFQSELEELAPMMEDGLLLVNDDGIQIQNAGRLLIRRVCMVFDEYLRKGPRIAYSKVI